MAIGIVIAHVIGFRNSSCDLNLMVIGIMISHMVGFGNCSCDLNPMAIGIVNPFHGCCGEESLTWEPNGDRDRDRSRHWLRELFL